MWYGTQSLCMACWWPTTNAISLKYFVNFNQNWAHIAAEINTYYRQYKLKN